MKGITSISSTFVEEAEALAQKAGKGDAAVAFLYLRFSETLTEWDIVLSIITQLVEWSEQLPAVVAAVKETFGRRRGPRKGGRPTFADLVQLLKVIIALYRQVDIMIDGMDEMKEAIQWLVAETVTSANARVLFTSRPIHFVEDRLKELTGDQLAVVNFAAPSEDLDLFIEGAIKGSPGLAALLKDKTSKENVMAKIKDKAAGMYVRPNFVHR